MKRGLDPAKDFFDDGMSFRQRRARQLRVAEMGRRMSSVASDGYRKGPLPGMRFCRNVVHANLAGAAIFLVVLAVFLGIRAINSV